MRTLTPERIAKMQEAKKKSAKRVNRISYKLVIREKCLDCSAQQVSEVRLCTVESCSLHPIRPFQPSK